MRAPCACCIAIADAWSGVVVPVGRRPGYTCGRLGQLRGCTAVGDFDPPDPQAERMAAMTETQMNRLRRIGVRVSREHGGRATEVDVHAIAPQHDWVTPDAAVLG